ncbi:unnamed protein product [Effrenium voratum]|uniref:25S rRNA (uridine-N(3))-methyltransferase BMT5-like domain-containing protein n=1 Tax=Effrenium voratum TaxID=2562239 RepID=A0AA36MGW8_9DINO|nr:unnamed protein product [Effrenium voratum]
MAHKNLKGVRKVKKGGLKSQFKAEKEKKRKEKERRKLKVEPSQEEGLRKWQKKALRAEKSGVSPAPAPKASAAEPKREAPEAKLSKKEVRLARQQLKQHRRLYEQSGAVLLVGEGNFSFARALCEVRGSGEDIFATCLDGEAILKRKYPDALELRKTVEERGGTTLSSVDATRLHKVKQFRGAFKCIVWNFPHLGAGEKDVEKSIQQHSDLLAAFFASALLCLSEDPASAVHVAMKHGEPYKSWKIVQVAKAASEGKLQLQTVVPFSLDAWPGYEHRRTRGFHEKFSKKDSEELAKGAKVYVFARGQGVAEEEDE